MTTTKTPQSPENAPETLGDDLLWGAQAFADELRVNVRKAFYLLENGRIPAQKIGGLWVGSRRALRERFALAGGADR
jgi:hypothetical protein